jgi:hypothetical protein
MSRPTTMESAIRSMLGALAAASDERAPVGQPAYDLRAVGDRDADIYNLGGEWPPPDEQLAISTAKLALLQVPPF